MGTGAPVTFLPFCPEGPEAAFCRKPGQRRTPAGREPVGPRPAHVPVLPSRIPGSLPSPGSSTLTCTQQPGEHGRSRRHGRRVDRVAAETLPASQSASSAECAGSQRRLLAGRTDSAVHCPLSWRPCNGGVGTVASGPCSHSQLVPLGKITVSSGGGNPIVQNGF